MNKRSVFASWLCAALVGLVASTSQATVLTNDNFSYVGALTDNGWIAYSGADGTITSDGSVASIGSGAEDIRFPFDDQLTGPTYASFILNVQSLPASGAEYSFGFIDSTAMESRFGIISVGGTEFRLGNWGSGSSIISTNAAALALNTDYLVTIYFDGTDDHRLWIDATTTDFGTPDAQASGANNGIDGFFIRQAGALDAGAASWTMGELIVATTFEDVVPAGGPPPTNVSFTISAASVDEDVGTYEVTITKSLPEGDVSGEISLGGTATEVDDYTIDTTNFVMNGATTSATITITIVDDEDPEPAETVILSLANVVGGTIATPSSFTLTINASDPLPPAPATVWINEINYDPPGTDSNEYVEVAGPAGTDLSAYVLVLYNGSGGAVYDTRVLEGIIPDEGCGFGAVDFVYPANGLQNGAPDGIALAVVDSGVTSLVQFLSYEGEMVGVGGPADGITSQDVGGHTNDVNTLQLIGTGTNYSDFTWTLAEASQGSLNAGQTIDPCDPADPVTNVSFTVASDVASEDSGVYVVTVVKSLPEGDVSGEVTLGGTATEGGDYTIDTTSFVMNGATTSATFAITIADDEVFTGDRTVVLTLANVVGGTIVAPSEFTLTILEDEVEPIPEPPEGTLATYYFTDQTANPSEVATNLTASAVGANDSRTVTFPAGNPDAAISATGWNVADRWWEFSLTVAGGYEMSVTNISFDERSSGTGPQEWFLRTSLDGFTSDLAGDVVLTNSTFDTQSAVLSIAGATGEVVFRIYGAGASSSAGTWRMDNLVLSGEVTLIGGGGDTTLDEYDVGDVTLSAGVISVTIPVTSNNVPYSLLYTTDLLTDPLVVSTADVDTATGGPLTLEDTDLADDIRIYWIRTND